MDYKWKFKYEIFKPQCLDDIGVFLLSYYVSLDKNMGCVVILPDLKICKKLRIIKIQKERFQKVQRVCF
jgi:hypothetical protein